MKSKLILPTIIIITFFSQFVLAETGDDISDGLMKCSEHIVSIALDAFYFSEETISSKKEAERQRLRELGYPEGYDPDNPVAMGEVDPYTVIEPNMEDVQRSMMEDAMNDYYQPEPDISDRVIKP